MKAKLILLIQHTMLAAILVMVDYLPAVAQNKAKAHQPVAVLMRYDVKEEHVTRVRGLLTSYVHQSLANEHNVMAEAYYEQNDPSVLWLIQRWDSKAQFERAIRSEELKGIGPVALSKAPGVIWIKDLEPISKKEWRRLPAKEDTPLTIMLFVDAKPGTEAVFKDVYHKAMLEFRTEPGVINYQLSQLTDDSTQFVTYEHFRSEAAFQYHLKFPPIQPVIDYLDTSIKKQPFQSGLHRLIAFTSSSKDSTIH